MYQYEGTLRSKNGHFRASVRNLYIFRYFLGINALIGRGFFQYQVCSTHLMAFSFHPLIVCLIYSVLGVLYCEIVDLYRKLISPDLHNLHPSRHNPYFFFLRELIEMNVTRNPPCQYCILGSICGEYRSHHLQPSL